MNGFLLFSFEDDDSLSKKEPKTRAKKRDDVSRVIRLMKNASCWVPITNKIHFEFLGFDFD